MRKRLAQFEPALGVVHAGVEVTGATEAFFRSLGFERCACSSGVALILAPLPLLDRHPDSGTHTVRVRAAIFTERQNRTGATAREWEMQ